VEAAALSLDEFLVAREGQPDLRVILVFDESAGADVVMVRPDITQPELLRDHRIGVENTASGALMLSRTLDIAGLRPEDVIKVPIVGSTQVSSYANGHLDAVVSFEPYVTQLARLGAVRLLDSRRFPGAMVDVLVARSSALDNSPGQFRQMLAGYFQALAMMQTEPTQAAALMTPTLGINAQELTLALSRVHMVNLPENRALLGGASADLRPMAQSVATLMLRSGLLTASPDLNEFTDMRFLPSA
jgi:NitT/TauT family transport system substrate-binding protein